MARRALGLLQLLLVLSQARAQTSLLSTLYLADQQQGASSSSSPILKRDLDSRPAETQASGE